MPRAARVGHLHALQRRDRGLRNRARAAGARELDRKQLEIVEVRGGPWLLAREAPRRAAVRRLAARPALHQLARGGAISPVTLCSAERFPATRAQTATLIAAARLIGSVNGQMCTRSCNQSCSVSLPGGQVPCLQQASSRVGRARRGGAFGQPVQASVLLGTMLAAGLFEGLYLAFSPGQDFLAIASRAGRLRTFDTSALAQPVQCALLARYEYRLDAVAYQALSVFRKQAPADSHSTPPGVRRRAMPGQAASPAR